MIQINIIRSTKPGEIRAAGIRDRKEG